MIKALFRLIGRLVILLAMAGLIVGGILVYEGYQLYEQALKETPVQQVMEEIKNKEDLYGVFKNQ